MSRNALLTLPVALCLSQPAWACGGFFCGAQTPVDQAAEEILFALAGDEVTMHVKIAYEGPAEDFSWVVPVAAEPTLEIGTDALFTTLSGLRARWQLTQDTDNCSMDESAASSTDAGYMGGGGVTIISTGAVGPYEQVTLLADDTAGLVDWLNSHNFDISDDFDTAIAPYVASGQYFVALRLAKDKDAGDLEPIALTYKGSIASIPIQLTSIAATPDMGLRVYVLGEHRAVPYSYLHVQLNHLSINWWTAGANVEDAIGLAADEAGGHAFFTDYAGSTEPVQGQIFSNAWDQIDLGGIDSAETLLLTLVTEGLPLDDPMLDVLAFHLGLPVTSNAELDLTTVFGCMSPGTYYGYSYGTTAGSGDCYGDELAEITFDPDALAADVELTVLEPRRRTEALLAAYPKISRMTSSVSPAEMTVDPTFVLNPDMGDVAQTRTAVEAYACRRQEGLFDARRALQLTDGRSVLLPSRRELSDLGMTEFEWLTEYGVTTPAAAIIERTSGSGQPEVLVDNRDLLEQQIRGLLSGGACSCTTSTPSPGWLATLSLFALFRRKQR